MYGFVNNAIKDYVVSTFGQPLWSKVKKECALKPTFLDAEQPYNEELILATAKAVSNHTQIPISDILRSFGEHISLTLSEKYKFLMESRGENLKDYLVNLPNFHNRIMLIYPELTPPEFRISNVAPNSLYLHYTSDKSGMKDLLIGYIDGLVKIFNETVFVETVESPNESRPQEVFKINW